MIKEATGLARKWICADDADDTHKVPLKFVVALSILAKCYHHINQLII